jgi:hypothetical protein
MFAAWRRDAACAMLGCLESTPAGDGLALAHALGYCRRSSVIIVATCVNNTAAELWLLQPP